MRRRRTLPPGWYPATDDQVLSQCKSWEADLDAPSHDYVAAVVPHAGWAFSGHLAFRTLRELRRPAETIVVAGGHLRDSDPLLIAPEDTYETPMGDMRVDQELADHLAQSFDTREDRVPDNTVEVQLPLLRYLFPGALVVAIRCPPGPLSVETGISVARYAIEHGREVRFVGSTDLTHYGPAYGFSPRGEGPQAVEWVREVNDRMIMDAMQAMDTEETVRLAVENRAACSSGAAAAAMSFSRELGAARGDLVGYAQSYDVRPDPSFVGYAGVGFRPEVSSDSVRVESG